MTSETPKCFYTPAAVIEIRVVDLELLTEINDAFKDLHQKYEAEKATRKRTLRFLVDAETELVAARVEIARLKHKLSRVAEIAGEPSKP